MEKWQWIYLVVKKMDNNTTGESIIGTLLGIVGYFASTIFDGLKVLYIPVDYLPSLGEALHSVIVASLCALAGFVTTKISHYVFVKIKRVYTDLIYKNKSDEKGNIL